MLFEAQLEHIEVAAEAGAARHGCDAGGIHRLRQVEGGRELDQGGAQAAQADPKLVQGLWIAVGQNLRLELAEAPGLVLDQLQGVGAVGE